MSTEPTQIHPVLAIVGPTGSGKSDLALHMAELFDGEIVSCDSVQVYTGLDIGSAKTPLHERRGVPHHLIDVASPNQDLTAGAYARLARQAIGEILSRRRLPVVVGGTGLYLRALFDGLSPAPLRSEPLRHRLQQLHARRTPALYRFLRRFDAVTAARIHPNDKQKLMRAVELIILGRQPAVLTQQQPRDTFTGVQLFKMGLDPDRRDLYARLDERSARLFETGLLEETAGLLASGVPPSAKPLLALGYKQAVQLLAGEMTRDEAVRLCQTKTRQYAKRQLTWFRHEPDVHWLNGFGSDAAIQQQAVTSFSEAQLGPER